MARGDIWFKILAELIVKMLKDALDKYNVIILNALQATECSVSQKGRAAESVVSFMVRKALEEMDSANPNKGKASKIEIHIDELRREWALSLIRPTLEMLLNEDLIRKTKNQNCFSLAPCWDRYLENIMISERNRVVYAAIFGRLVGTSVTKEVSQLRPIIRIIKEAEENDSKIFKERVREIYKESCPQRERGYSLMIERDSTKDDDIRFIQSEDKEFFYINRNCLILLPLWIELGRKLFHERYIIVEGGE